MPVRAAAGEPVYQVVGSSANPGLRDFAVLAAITAGRKAHPRVSITDPRDLPSRLGIEYPALALPLRSGDGGTHLEAPLPDGDARQVELVKEPSIGSLPDLEPMPADLRAPVAIKVGDNVSTDEILPAGARVLPFRSDIARLAGFTFSQVDEGYVQRAREAGTHVIVAGENYGQGSSREHAVIAPATSGCDW